jgi:hypothetical protein
LSAVRAVRASDAFDTGIDLTDKQANHQLLSELLRRKAEILEIPVQFFPISPERVKRTSPFEGVQALATIVWRRFVPMHRTRLEDVPSPRVSEQPSSSSVRSPR